MMRYLKIRTISLILLILLTACSSLPGFKLTTTPPSATATQQPLLPERTATTSGSTLSNDLLIWLPPEFDPNAENEAGAILAAHLKAFSEKHPDMQVETRVKATQGPAGLMDSLTTAAASAPLVLPDVIILPTNQLREAAEKNLILPIDDLWAEPFQVDWYPFAVNLATHNGRIYGLPFAVETLVMVYRPSSFDSPPNTWQESLSTPGPLSFPAANIEALFTTALYLSDYPSLYDDAGQLYLDQAGIEAVFEFYRQGLISDLLPFWLAQSTDDESAWQVFSERRATSCITWSSRYLKDESGIISAAPLPTRSGEAFTLTHSWTLAFPVKDPEKYTQSLLLAEYLTESAFLGKWTEAAGYFPPRTDSLLVWQPGPQQLLGSQILPQGIAIPLQKDLIILGESITPATISILKAEKTPQQVTQEIIEQLSHR